jgi:hypothetical protein
MWFLPESSELSYKTSRAKIEVIKSLEDIAGFEGDRFKFPVRIFGNKLFVRRKLVVGEGILTENDQQTLVKITLQASGQIKFAFVFTALLSLLTFIIAFVLLFSGRFNFLSFVGLIAMSLFWLVPPRIMYLLALEMRKKTIEHLVKTGND